MQLSVHATMPRALPQKRRRLHLALQSINQSHHITSHQSNRSLQVGLMVDRYRNMSQGDWQHRCAAGGSCRLTARG